MAAPSLEDLATYRAAAQAARALGPWYLGQEPVEVRLWGRVTVTESGCWEFDKTRSTASPYGSIQYSRQCFMAHRLAWMLTHGVTLAPCAAGPTATDTLVLHRCDNPPCINPAHLFLGTHLDNRRDCKAKGRIVALRGEDNPLWRPLTDETRARIIDLRVNRGWSVLRVAAEVGEIHKRVVEACRGLKPAHSRGVAADPPKGKRGSSYALSVAEQMRSMRAAGMAQQDIADQLGVTRSTVVRYTQGVLPRKANCRRRAS
jgi:DNA-binding CsgD family transcriptional regulator